VREFKISNKGTARIFENPLLERLSRTHFSVPVVFYYTVAAACLLVSFLNEEIIFSKALWIFPSGMIFFSLLEYLIHRFLFHFDAKTEKELQLQYNIHGVHHEFPRDKDRLVMPPVISIFLALSFFFLFRLLMGDYGFIFFAGFVAGYSTYLIIHYAVHTLKPPKNFLKIYWKHHSLHHYSSVNAAYSVSLPFWDHLFGTMPALKGAAGGQSEGRLPDSQ
jgi:4-hydroxysphinganine ceramide fatty acyl 2-hydroxylase